MGFDTANLFWDDGQNRLGLTINTPTHTLTLGSTSTGAAHYNTVDTTTNYERAVLKWVSNAFSVSMEKGGSGINRTFNVSGTYALGSGVQTAMSITPGTEDLYCEPGVHSEVSPTPKLYLRFISSSVIASHRRSGVVLM